jgi:hypothetical protein
MAHSWEYTGLSNQAALANETPSSIGYDLPAALSSQVEAAGSIDLMLAVNEYGRRMTRAERPEDSYLVRLHDRS